MSRDGFFLSWSECQTSGLRVEARFGEVVDDGGEMGGVFGFELDGVGDGGRGRRGFRERCGRWLGEGEAFLVKVGGAGGAEVDVEGLFEVGDAVLGADECLRRCAGRAADGNDGAERELLLWRCLRLAPW